MNKFLSTPATLHPLLHQADASAHARRRGRRHAVLGSLAVLTIALVTGGGDTLAVVFPGDGARQTACTANTALFPRDTDEEATFLEQWRTDYHNRVTGIVDEYTEFLQRGGDCDAQLKTPPLDFLRALAEDLGAEDVHEEDAPALLLRYLTEYECTLKAESFVVVQQAATDTAGEDGTVRLDDLPNAIQDAESLIAEEITLSSRALHRTLLYLSGYGRLQPLGKAIQCLAGASVDIKNTMSLAAEAASCMPRALDAHTSLRSLSTP